MPQFSKYSDTGLKDVTGKSKKSLKSLVTNPLKRNGHCQSRAWWDEGDWYNWPPRNELKSSSDVSSSASRDKS